MVNFMEEATDEELDELFGALANTKRREMIIELSFRPATVSQLATQHGLSLPAMHKHVRTLEQAKLIQRRKVGRINFVAIERSALRRLQTWANQFNTEWGNGRESLENYIASMQRAAK